jgi:hypothetical protein
VTKFRCHTPTQLIESPNCAVEAHGKLRQLSGKFIPGPRDGIEMPDLAITVESFTCPSAALLLSIQVFAGHVVLGHLMRANFPLCAFSGVFDAQYHSSLERVAFLDQLVNTF